MAIRKQNRIDVVPKRVSDSSTRSAETSSNSPVRSDKQPSPILDRIALNRIAALSGVVLAYPDFRLNRVEVLRDGKAKKTLAVGLPAEAAHLRFVNNILIALGLPGLIRSRHCERSDLNMLAMLTRQASQIH